MTGNNLSDNQLFIDMGNGMSMVSNSIVSLSADTTYIPERVSGPWANLEIDNISYETAMRNRITTITIKLREYEIHKNNVVNVCSFSCCSVYIYCCILRSFCQYYEYMLFATRRSFYKSLDKFISKLITNDVFMKKIIPYGPNRRFLYS